MSAGSSVNAAQVSLHPHAEFLVLLPFVERHASFAFRHRKGADREEAIGEAVAAAFQTFVALRARGKDPCRSFPHAVATFAVLHVLNDRHVGGRTRSNDVLSDRARRKHGFRVEMLPASPRSTHEALYGAVDGQRKQDEFDERLQDPGRTPIPDLVAFRLDFHDFLQTLTHRDRELARFLSVGNSAQAAAKEFNLTPGRVTQLRQRWQRDWLVFQGEMPVDSPSYKGRAAAKA